METLIVIVTMLIVPQIVAVLVLVLNLIFRQISFKEALEDAKLFRMGAYMLEGALFFLYIIARILS